MQGKLARPVWGWGPGETPGPTPLFVGSPAAGDRASVLMSLVASCKTNQVEPWAYLRSIFTQLPTDPDLEQLLPERWLANHPEHHWKIADQRKEERLAKA